MTLWDFELPEDAVQPFSMGRGEGLKLYSNPMRAGPADGGALDQNGNLVSREVEQEVYFHPGDDVNRTFEATALAREIQRFGNEMREVLIDKGAGEGCVIAWMLSQHHNSGSFLERYRGTVGSLYYDGILQM